MEFSAKRGSWPWVSCWKLLREALAEGIECRIEGFSGDFDFLSNFYPAAVDFERLCYPTVEHAYQAAKVRDRSERERIAALATPGAAKRAGKKLGLRPDWETIKLQVMEELLGQKFHNHAELAAQLRATGDCYLEETNTWGDRFWGVCGGKGDNYLGRILIRVRTSLRDGGSAP